MRLAWSAHAVSDLQAISEYIEQDRNLVTANRVTRIIYDAARSLRSHPYRGRYGRLANTRELIVPRIPYVVIYRVLQERVTIVSVLHGAQRWP